MAVDTTTPPAKSKAEKPKDWTIEVEAYRHGTYPPPDQLAAWLREPGVRFFIKNVTHFSSAWMRVPGAPVGHAIDEFGKPVDADGRRFEVFGHGPMDAVDDSLPQTTISNRVRDPLQVLAETSQAHQVRGR